VQRGELLLSEAEKPSSKARRAFDFEGLCPSSSPSQKAVFSFGGLGERPPKREGFALTATSLRTGQKGRSESKKVERFKLGSTWFPPFRRRLFFVWSNRIRIARMPVSIDAVDGLFGFVQCHTRIRKCQERLIAKGHIDSERG
jgi:hypothetical protein